MEGIPMNILRHAAQFVLDLNKLRSIAAVKLYGKLGLYKKIYIACGLPDEVAIRLEEKMIDAMYRGVEERHVLASPWAKGESDLSNFLDQYKDWFAEYVDRCGSITVEELCQAA
jgi:hypothetical protein